MVPPPAHTNNGMRNTLYELNIPQTVPKTSQYNLVPQAASQYLNSLYTGMPMQIRPQHVTDGLSGHVTNKHGHSIIDKVRYHHYITLLIDQRNSKQ